MYHTTSLTSRSTADDLRAYGLAGVELHRATERRRDRLATGLTLPDRLTATRQWLGDAMIRLGTGLAGDAARAPRVAPDIHPKTGGA